MHCIRVLGVGFRGFGSGSLGGVRLGYLPALGQSFRGRVQGLGSRALRGARLGCLLALGSGDGLDGAEGPVEPGLLGSLHLVESQTQVVLQILVEERERKII